MVRLATLVLISCICLSIGGLPGQDPKPKPALPRNWEKLKLTEEQLHKVYKVLADNAEKIAKLEAELKKLKDREQAEMEKVLTEAQKSRLKEALDKLPADKER